MYYRQSQSFSATHSDYRLQPSMFSLYFSLLERLHEARLERERIIVEHQLQQENRPRKTKQKDIATTPKPSPVKVQKKQVVPQGVVSPTRENHGMMSASLPLSGAKQPNLSTVITSLPERVC